MALATAKAAPLRSDIRLFQALSDYEAILSAEQKQSYKTSPPDANAVMAFTCEIDRQNAGRRTRRCGARLTSFLNSVKGFTSIVDLIVSSSGNPIAGGVWGAVKTAIQAAVGFEAYFDSLSTLLMNVGLTAPRFEKYALLYPTSTILRKELCHYYSVVVNLCTRIVLFVKKPFIKQIASALRKPFEDEFGTFQKDLIRLGTEVKEEVSLASKQLQSRDSIEAAQERKESSLFRTKGSVFRKDIAHELEQARKWRQGRAKARFLDSCSTYNFETTLNQTRKKGGLKWIFQHEEYRQWTSRTSSSTLLCSGIVGAGKTVLCANVVENLIVNKYQSSSLGYFFCRYDEAASLKAREVIGSLARQLFEDIPAEEFQIDQMEPYVGDITLNIEQILSKMRLLLPCHRHYIMVIDGLDECEYSEVKALVESIQSLMQTSKQVFKVFLTGRSDFALRTSEQLQPAFQIHISSFNNGPEISSYIELALVEALENNRLKLRDPGTILKIQDALELGAHEMFLWVAFQIDSICALNTDHEIIDSLKDLPKGLPETFRRILHRLQHLTFADPSLGRKIFEIVAAAQRPLTLDELGEAISITPGDTLWDRSKLINDVLRSLESCGSFLVVDEELSTVHFAHSSAKEHLLTEPTDLDVRQYHIDLIQADFNLGKIVVTYLNLNILGNQLSKTSGPSQIYADKVPSFVIRSALPKRDVVNKMTLAILRGRKNPGKDSSLSFEKSADLLSEKNTQMQEVFPFLAYCREYWLYHSKNFYDFELDRVKLLWIRLVDGLVNTVELPWAPENMYDVGERFIGWITKNYHHSLAKRTIQILWQRPTVERLEEFLILLKIEDALRAFELGDIDMSSTRPREYLLQEAASRGYETVVRLVLFVGVDINAQSEEYGNALHAAISSGKKTITELLIETGADVNCEGGKYGSALQAAAATRDMNPIVRLLLEKGADVNTCGGEYGTALVAAARGNNMATLRLLLYAGADVNAAALNATIANLNLVALDILLRAGADVDEPDENHESPLQVAARLGTNGIMNRLLVHRATSKHHEIFPLQHTGLP